MIIGFRVKKDLFISINMDPETPEGAIVTIEGEESTNYTLTPVATKKTTKGGK